MKILILEDDLISRKILSRILNEYGSITEAVTGVEALDYYHAAADNNQKFDLLCLDIMVPELSGETALQNIREAERELPKEQKSKILMVTALDGLENIMTAFNHECDGYIIKPINKEKIRNMLLKIGLLEKQ